MIQKPFHLQDCHTALAGGGDRLAEYLFFLSGNFSPSSGY
jgi:hypothetical protein